MEWNNRLIIEFIEIYEKHPVLWNAKHPRHKNRNALNDAWLDISKEMNIDVPITELKKKKESILSTYRTLRKKVVDSLTTGSGTDDIYKPCWFAYDAIDRFIRVTKDKIPSLSTDNDDPTDVNVPETDNQEAENELMELGQLGIQNQEETDTAENTDSNTNQENPKHQFQKPETVKKRKRTTNFNDQTEIATHLKIASAALQNITKKEGPTHQDACALYGQLLAEKLRKLPTRTRLLLQNKIDNLIFTAEYENVGAVLESFTPYTSSDSSTSNTPSPSPTLFTQPPSPSPPYTHLMQNVPINTNSTPSSYDNQNLPNSCVSPLAAFYSHFE